MATAPTWACSSWYAPGHVDTKCVACLGNILKEKEREKVNANPFDKPSCAPLGIFNNPVNHPAHYGGESNPYEAIKVIDAWQLGFALGNAVKYIARAGKKQGSSEEQDLKKALWYIQHRLEQLKNASTPSAS